MVLPFDGKDDKAGNIRILAKQLELERDRLAIVIDIYGMKSKEAYLQSQVVDKLVVRYMKSMRNE